jgi:hypothetical protein
MPTIRVELNTVNKEKRARTAQSLTGTQTRCLCSICYDRGWIVLCSAQPLHLPLNQARFYLSSRTVHRPQNLSCSVTSGFDTLHGVLNILDTQPLFAL